MVASPKSFTVESLTTFIRNNPDAAFDAVNALPEEEARLLLAAIPRDAYHEMMTRALLTNLRNVEKTRRDA